MPDDDLIVEVEAPAPVAAEPTPEPKPEATPKPAAKAAAPDPVVDLKAQLETMRADKTAEATARQRAEADATAARAEATQAKAAVVDANISTVDSAIAAAQAEADGFARDQEAALAAGKFADAALAARKAARAEARIESLEQGKVNLTARKAEPAKPQSTQSVEQSAFDRAIAGSAPRAQAWLRAHPTYVTDPELNAQAALAHQRALKQGIPPDSDAYFDFCERDLGLKQEAVTETKPPKQQQRAAAMPSAPVSRDGAPSGGTSSTQVTLTPGEQRAATDGSVVWNYNDPKIGAVKGNPVGLKEYAKRKAAMTQEGRYDRSFTEQ